MIIKSFVVIDFSELFATIYLSNLLTDVTSYINHSAIA
ncbi:hypothetical protein Belba_2179 [Belliella baltica DSM 15883]|uniref:Uncharacterized protein n=1 Tax=Belliella baltica (strain DSM 15883 / CIP 108006 / LMG 21964 / BA134) TaxID=866536 RepID=I3Z678_BELBD|nr:hypothetical protein Belba_2179 [Belliella baltica DSM 15883]